MENASAGVTSIPRMQSFVQNVAVSYAVRRENHVRTMSKKTEPPYTVLIDDNGEPYYASLSDLAALCERDENFLFKVEHDFQDEDDYGYD